MWNACCLLKRNSPPNRSTTRLAALGSARNRPYNEVHCIKEGMSSADAEISLLLREWRSGDPQAVDRLIPLVYDRLRQLAHKRLRNEQHASLNTTALVHEAYLKLVESNQITPRDRSHFLSLMARVMRNLLVDHARARKSAKRGAGAITLELDEMAWISDADLNTYS